MKVPQLLLQLFFVFCLALFKQWERNARYDTQVYARLPYTFSGTNRVRKSGTACTYHAVVLLELFFIGPDEGMKSHSIRDALSATFGRFLNR